jgi:hypothetical protein
VAYSKGSDMTKLTMKSTAAQSGKVSAAWYLLPAFWMLIVLTGPPAVPAPNAARTAVAAAPDTEPKSGVPAASTANVRYWDVLAEMQQF